jgi:hypothetical protein
MARTPIPMDKPDNLRKTYDLSTKFEGDFSDAPPMEAPPMTPTKADIIEQRAKQYMEMYDVKITPSSIELVITRKF